MTTILYTDVPGRKLLMREALSNGSMFLEISTFTAKILDEDIASGAVVSANSHETALRKAEEFQRMGLHVLPVNLTLVRTLTR